MWQTASVGDQRSLFTHKVDTTGPIHPFVTHTLFRQISLKTSKYRALPDKLEVNHTLKSNEETPA